MDGRLERSEELDRPVELLRHRGRVPAPAGEFREQQLGEAHLEQGAHCAEAGEGLSEARVGVLEVIRDERDPPKRPPGSGLHEVGSHLVARLKGMAHVAARLLEAPGREIGLAEPDPQHPRVPGVGEGGLLLDGTPDELDRLPDVPLLPMREAEDAERERPAERVGRTLEAPRAVSDRGLPLAPGGQEPTAQEVGVALQTTVAKRLADLPRPAS